MQWITAGWISAAWQVGDGFFASITPEQGVHDFLERHLVRCNLPCVLLVIGKGKALGLPLAVERLNGPALLGIPHVHQLLRLNGVVGEVLMDVVDVEPAQPRLDLEHALIAPVMG